jgi:organic radical activating enzyme
MNIEFDVTLQCNFSCPSCNRHSNFNALTDPFDKDNAAGLNYYENTNVTMDHVDKLISDCKKQGKIERIHIIGGEPLTHPNIADIVDRLRDNLWGDPVPNIVIISNLHPKMLKAGTLDTPDRVIKYFPFEKINKIKLAYIDHINPIFKSINEYINQNNITKEQIINNLDKIVFEMPNQVSLKEILSRVNFFRGIPVTNFTPLDEKGEIHRCSLVAPYDSGQEMIPQCNIPNRCGVNYSFDGYWPCSNGSAIARLFKLNGYNRKTLPDSFTDWSGVDEKGNAQINKKSDMWEMCKMCQVAAKNKMSEKDHGRPISISYRKALGLEKSEEPLSEYVIEKHSKRLASAAILKEGVCLDDKCE